MGHPGELDLLKRALTLYAGEHVLERVLTLGAPALELGGEISFATVMFIDVTKLVPAAERFEWPKVNEALAQYFTVVAEASARTGGLLDAPIGDAAISYWVGDASADRACKCALDIVARLASAPTIPKVVPKIGIHSGQVLVGNGGSKERLRFTVAGGVVNTASGVSRMAPASEGLPIVLTESTKQLLRSDFKLTPMEPVNVKGMADPLGLFGLHEA